MAKKRSILSPLAHRSIKQVIKSPGHPERKFPADKGEMFGSCNRSACLSPGADHYNYSTNKWYCWDCAVDLNRWNRKDAFKLYGHDLCHPAPSIFNQFGV